MSVTWAKMVLRSSDVLDAFANSEVGEPQPKLFERNKSRKSNGLGEAPELDLDLRAAVRCQGG